MDETNSNKIRDKLIEYSKNITKETIEKDAKGQIKDPNKYSLEFLFGVILDQGIKYEKAWSSPNELKNRLGELNVEKIASMNEKELEEVMFKKPALHRFRYMAKRLIEASKLVLDKYEGDALNIWKKPVSAKELESRFREFKQIGQKKASMAVNILVRDFNIQISGDKSGIDVSNDVNLRRVFHRTGLIKGNSEEELINAAKKLNPEYPGELDYPAWDIGRRWCHENDPNCKECPLNEACPKILT